MGESVGKLVLLYIVGENINWGNLLGVKFDEIFLDSMYIHLRFTHSTSRNLFYYTFIEHENNFYKIIITKIKTTKKSLGRKLSKINHKSIQITNTMQLLKEWRFRIVYITSYCFMQIGKKIISICMYVFA